MNRVREIREAEGLTVKQLASKMGVCEATIRRHEKGKHEPLPSIKKAYAAIFECGIEEVFP